MLYYYIIKCIVIIIINNTTIIIIIIISLQVYTKKKIKTPVIVVGFSPKIT